MRAVLGWCGQVVAWLVILGMAVILTVAVLVPRLGGATPYAVLTGSMQPDYPPGTLVVAEPVPFDEIVIGDVITYQLRSGEPEVVTHRVIGEKTQPDGTPVLVTQGDANDSADAAGVLEEQVRGRLWYAVPYLGRVNGLLTGREQQAGVYVAAAALLGYAVFMLGSAIRDRRRKQDDDPLGPAEPQAAGDTSEKVTA